MLAESGGNGSHFLHFLSLIAKKITAAFVSAFCVFAGENGVGGGGGCLRAKKALLEENFLERLAWLFVEFAGILYSLHVCIFIVYSA